MANGTINPLRETPGQKVTMPKKHVEQDIEKLEDIRNAKCKVKEKGRVPALRQKKRLNLKPRIRERPSLILRRRRKRRASYS